MTKYVLRILANFNSFNISVKSSYIILTFKFIKIKLCISKKKFLTTKLNLKKFFIYCQLKLIFRKKSNKKKTSENFRNR